jgi:hypothetical protein
VTYGRRYGLQAAVGLAAQDDDAEAAMGRKESKGKQAASDDLLDKIIESFSMQTTIADLDAKLAKAKTTPYKDDQRMLDAYNRKMQELNTK